MQTLDVTTLRTPSGVMQVPILMEDQLTVGTLLTFTTAQHILEVEHVWRGGAETLVVCRRVGTPIGHTHAFDPTTRICPCGAVCFPVRDFLPLSPGVHRLCALVPIRETAAVDPWTIYIGGGGLAYRSALIGGISRWVDDPILPVIPVLHPVWTLPERLRPGTPQS